jgi:ubiquinone/menaquinone biosynthesis C-methylase UbiE
MHVLDLGCGLGGSSRYLASACGCSVSAIDLTLEFVELARLLTARCGPSEKIDYRQGSALALPFEAGSFDHVWCHHVTMNIADRKTLAREVARVLRRNGRFSCVEVAQGEARPLGFPLPWASDPSTSFLATPEEMRRNWQRRDCASSSNLISVRRWRSSARRRARQMTSCWAMISRRVCRTRCPD